jgi:acetyl esterase
MMMQAMAQMMERPRGDLAGVADVVIPADGHDLPARVYHAAAPAGPAPVLLFFHGGGWVIGDLGVYDSLCAETARQLGMTVVSVDYRLAPEHRFPAAPEDCLAATRWLAGSPEAVGHPVTGIVLAGDSAGGNLAAICAQQLSGTLAVPLLAQWLIYPGTDMTAATGSMQEFADGYLLTSDSMTWFMDHYFEDGADRTGPLASPALTGNVVHTPPALVFTCGLDPLRDQGRAYAAQLVAAGVPTVFQEAAGQIHGCYTLRQAIPSAQDDLSRNLAALKAMLAA